MFKVMSCTSPAAFAARHQHCHTNAHLAEESVSHHATLEHDALTLLTCQGLVCRPSRFSLRMIHLARSAALLKVATVCSCAMVLDATRAAT